MCPNSGQSVRPGWATEDNIVIEMLTKNLPKTFVGTMGHAEDDITFDAGHMCSDIIEKQRCFFMIFMKIPIKITIFLSEIARNFKNVLTNTTPSLQHNALPLKIGLISV